MLLGQGPQSPQKSEKLEKTIEHVEEKIKNDIEFNFDEDVESSMIEIFKHYELEYLINSWEDYLEVLQNALKKVLNQKRQELEEENKKLKIEKCELDERNSDPKELLYSDETLSEFQYEIVSDDEESDESFDQEKMEKIR